MRPPGRGGESAGSPAVALLSLREPVSSPRRHRRKQPNACPPHRHAARDLRARRAGRRARPERDGRHRRARARPGPDRDRAPDGRQHRRSSAARSPRTPAGSSRSSGSTRRRSPGSRSPPRRSTRTAPTSRAGRPTSRGASPRARASRARPRPAQRSRSPPRSRRRSPSSAPRRPAGTAPASTAARPPAALRMTRKLLGVAHKKLPCGTPVAIAYEGKSITVPVVDRGPFVARPQVGPHDRRRQGDRIHVHGPRRRGPRSTESP